MERRSRSQVRRLENGGVPPHTRHASSSRVEAAQPPSLDNRAAVESQSRTLSPERKDRSYRASGRGFPITGYPDRSGGGAGGGYADRSAGFNDRGGVYNGGGYPPDSNMPQSHSNSNSYNQYNSGPLMNPYGEVAPPRPTPPTSLPANLTQPPSQPVSLPQPSPTKNTNLTDSNNSSSQPLGQVAIILSFIHIISVMYTD